MHKYKLKPQAEKDLEMIYENTFLTWGLIQTDKYLNELEEGFKIIAQKQKIEKKYNFTTLEYRYLHVNRHLIFYRIEKEMALIIRILHDRMKIKDSLQNPIPNKR